MFALRFGGRRTRVLGMGIGGMDKFFKLENDKLIIMINIFLILKIL